MGVVYKARQLIPPRLVALKMILHGPHASSQVRLRFQREAEAVARMQHAHIVQIFEYGEHEGHPYFAMELLDGGSLHAKLDHQPQPPMEAVRVVTCLAEAVQYAHDHKIVHRDLKPANVLLNAQGEPKLSDFGLARWLDDDAHLTPSGARLGTIAYMAPEQASGKIHEIGPAVDVYGLGAILYQMLTGRAPFVSAATAHALLQVVQDEPIAPRRLNPEAPLDLEAICLKCLEKAPAHRYGSARELAEDLQRFQRNEPTRARPIGSVGRALRWCQRKPAAAGLIAAAAVLAIGIVAGAFWYQGDRARLDREELARQAETAQNFALTSQGVRQAVDRARQIRAELQSVLQKRGGVQELLNQPSRWQFLAQSARSEITQARRLAARAERPLEAKLMQDMDQLAEQLKRDDGDRLLALRLEEIRMDKSMVVQGKFDFRTVADEYPRALAATQILHDDPTAVAARLASSAIKEQLLAALDDWAFVAFRLGDQGVAERVLATARATAPDSAWGDRLRQVSLWRDPKAIAKLVAAAPRDLSPQVLQLVGHLLQGLSPDQEIWLRRAQAAHPGDFWLNFDLGSALQKINPGEAVGFCRAAVAIRPGSSVAYANLGDALHGQHKLEEAVAAYRKAIAIEPKQAVAHNGLGVVYHAQHKPVDAAAAFANAIAINPKYASAYNNLGTALGDQGKLPQAEAQINKAIELNPAHALAWKNLGNVLQQQHKLLEAIAAYQKAIAIDPESAPAYYGLATAYRRQRKLDEAVATYRRAIKIDPKYAEAYNNLGTVLADQQKFSEAITAFRQAIKIDPSHAFAYHNLGNALAAHGKGLEAIAAYQKAVAIAPKCAEWYYDLGIVLATARKLSEAIAAFRKASALDPKLANAHGALGFALLEQGSFVESAKSSRKALELLPKAHPLRAGVEGQLKNAQHWLALEKRLPQVLDGRDRAKPDELLEMAFLCHQRKKQDGGAAQLYARAFDARPTLGTDLSRHYRYQAACAAVLGATEELRRTARVWLQADLALYAKLLEGAKPEGILLTAERLAHWQKDPDLAGVRDARALGRLPKAEREDWRKLWDEVKALGKNARSRFSETRHPGSLSREKREQIHELELTVANTYRIDMVSEVFDCLLRLEDAHGKVLAASDNIAPNNPNARINFTPKIAGTYRIVATSVQKRGSGAYTLINREFRAKPQALRGW
jgi:serine/threonine-protein kinase